MFNLIKSKRNKTTKTNQNGKSTTVTSCDKDGNDQSPINIYNETILVKNNNDQTDHHQQTIDENNNNDTNHNYYERDVSPDIAETDGRISGGSRESAFSSAPSDASDSLSSASDGCETNNQFYQDNSGRSSALDTSLQSSSSDDEPKQKLINVLATIRERVLTSASNNGRIFDENNNKASELYDKLDIQGLIEPMSVKNLEYHLAYKLTLRYINPLLTSTEFLTQSSVTSDIFLKDHCDEIEKICENLKEFLRFRKQYRLNYLKIDDFPKEFLQLNGIFTFGHDKEGTPVLYISAHVHRKWSPKLDELFKCYVAWHVNRVTGSTLDSQENLSHFVMCFDCDQIGYSNIDIEFLRFLVSLLLNHYPRFCKLCLIKDNPWVFRSIWTLVKSWLTEEARNAVHLITAKQLTDFIAHDQIPNNMKVNNFSDANKKDASGRFKFPESFQQMKTIDDFVDKLDISQDELRKLKAHVAKIEMEYLELGAIV